MSNASSPQRRPGRPRHNDADAAAIRPRAIAQLAETFRREGYDGASLATLSKATGLGKSSLYHYFPGGKVEMAHEVLDFIFAAASREIVAAAAREGPPDARLADVLRRLERYYAHGTKACILGRLCASADRREFSERLTHIFNAQANAFAQLLIEARVPRLIARARAEDAVLSIQGALVLTSGTGNPAPFHRMMARLRRDLLAPVHKTRR